MLEILKKQWFVILVAVIFIGFTVFITYDVNKGKLPGKTEGGKDVVVSLKDGSITADDFYEALDAELGDLLLFQKFSAAVYDESISLDDDMKAEAKALEENIIKAYKQQYPTEYEKVLNTQLAQFGFTFDELDYYCRATVKAAAMQKEYLEQDLAGYYKETYENTTPRSVSHILIKMKDASNPTEEEAAKVKAVEEALASGKDFAEVAKQYSDDTSASNGGTIGYVDSNSPLVKSFHEVALSLNKGEVSSDWIKVDASTKASYQGWHMIKVDETDMEALMNNEAYKGDIYTAIFKNDSTLSSKMIWDYAKKLDVTMADDVKERLLNYMGIEE